MNENIALISFLRKKDYELMKDGEIIYCLSQIERYELNNKELDSSLAIRLKDFKSELLSIKRSRKLNKILS
jgi:hypothetical protein